MFPIRFATPSDMPLVLSSWCSSIRHINHYKHMEPGVFSLVHGRLRALFDAGTITVAFDVKDPTLIYGWCCHTDDALHFIWTRFAFRRLGIATDLVKNAFNGRRVDYTEHTRDVDKYDLPKKWNLNRYDPFGIDELFVPQVRLFNREILEDENKRKKGIKAVG